MEGPTRLMDFNSIMNESLKLHNAENKLGEPLDAHIDDEAYRSNNSYQSSSPFDLSSS